MLIDLAFSLIFCKTFQKNMDDIALILLSLLQRNSEFMATLPRL